jgi:hypothetical protein
MASFLDSMNPQVRDYLLKKKEEEAALAAQNEGGFVSNKLAPALAAAGAGFMGRDPLAAAQSIQNSNAAQKKSIMDNFQKSKADELGAMDMSRQADKYDREMGIQKEDDDPNSETSKMYQSLASKYPGGQALVGKSATEIKKVLPTVEKIAELESRKQENAIKRNEAANVKNMARDLKNEEKMMTLSTPFGVARTADDAKKLKDGFEEKKVFDAKLQEMIALREKHGGGATMNREDVARGKQLSKDLLLTYKNMAKLGVLSQADENIINAIIPSDPLAYNSPLAAVQGQDPILNNLKKFKGDSDNDFQTRIKTRVREGSEIAPQIEENKIANDDEKAIARQKRIQELKSLARK